MPLNLAKAHNSRIRIFAIRTPLDSCNPRNCKLQKTLAAFAALTVGILPSAHSFGGALRSPVEGFEAKICANLRKRGQITPPDSLNYVNQGLISVNALHFTLLRNS